MIADNEKLVDRLQLAESMDDPSSPAGKRIAQLQSQIEGLQEEIYKLESGRDDYRIKYEVSFGIYFLNMLNNRCLCFYAVLAMVYVVVASFTLCCCGIF